MLHGVLKTNRGERDRLLMRHLQQVRQIAMKLHARLPSHVPLDDLVSAGIVGLLDAIDKFDARKKVPLWLYANFRIRGAILDSLREMDWGPRRLRSQARSLDKARRDLELQLGRTPDEQELAAALGLALDNLWDLQNQLHSVNIGRLDDHPGQGPGSDNELIGDLIRGAEQDPYFKCLHEEIRSAVLRALETLDEKKREVVVLYELKEFTMKEVGAALGLGESRVSQIHSEAMQHLRSRLHEDFHAAFRSMPKRA